MFKKDELYLSTVPAQERPSIWQHRSMLLQIIGAFVVLCIGIIIGQWVVTSLLVISSVGFIAYKAYRLNEALQPPPLGVASRPEEARPAARTIRSPRTPATEPAEALTDEVASDEEVAEVVAEADAEEDVLYKERAHPLLLFEDLGRVAPMVIGCWAVAVILLVLSMVDDRSAVKAVLVACAAGAVITLAAGSVKWFLGGLFTWLKWPALVALAVSLIYLAALQWLGALVLVIGAFTLIGAFIALRAWARWYHVHYLVTNKRISIVKKIPWYYFMEDSSPSLPIKKLTSLTPKQSVFEKWLERKFWGMESGFFEADTPGQQDNIFHDMRRVRRYPEVQKILEALI